MVRRTQLFGVVLGLFCVILPVAADPPVGTPSPGWLTWSMNLDSSAPPRASGLDQEEFEELLLTIERIGALYRSTPYLNRPTNAEVSPNRTILPRVGTTLSRQGIRTTDTGLPARHPLKEWFASHPGETDGKGPVRAAFALGIYRPVYHPRNRLCSITLQINDPWMDGRIVFEDDSGGIYLPWPSLESKEGRLRYQVDRRTVLEKILPPERDPWLPVSQGRWIRLLIAHSERELENHRARIVSEAPQRRERFMKSYNAMKPLDAEQAEQMLQNFERTERVYARVAATIEAEDYDGLEASGDRGRAMMGRHKLALEAELAGLTAAERAAPAYGFEYDPAMYWMPRRAPKRPSLLQNPGDQNALPLLAPNPDFFRRDLPATQIQSITIINGLVPEFSERLEQELDWTALARMVR